MPRVTLGARVVDLLPGETVLDGLLRSGAYFPYHCRAGACHTCLAEALEGSPTAAAQGDLSDREKANGWFLACVCRPEQDLVVRAVC